MSGPFTHHLSCSYCLAKIRPSLVRWRLLARYAEHLRGCERFAALVTKASLKGGVVRDVEGAIGILMRSLGAHHDGNGVAA